MNEKKFKRKIKELGLYKQFLDGLKQANHLEMDGQYMNLCDSFDDVKILREFLMLVNDKKAGGLKAFVGVVRHDFSHVKQWMEMAPSRGYIKYDGIDMRYSAYMEFKGIER